MRMGVLVELKMVGVEVVEGVSVRDGVGVIVSVGVLVTDRFGAEG